jgi:hypothetical protein
MRRVSYADLAVRGNEVSVGRAEPDRSDRAPNSRAHLVSSPTVASRYKARKFVPGTSRVRELETKVSEEIVWIGHTGMLAPALALGQLDPILMPLLTTPAPQGCGQPT